MNKIDEQKLDLFTSLKRIVLNYFPCTNNRLNLLCDSRSPQLEIDFKIYKEESKIIFMIGNNCFKQKTPDLIQLNELLSFDELKKFIDYILADHDFFKIFNVFENTITMVFSINWNEKNLKGMTCDDICLNLNFNDIEMEKEFIYYLIVNYYDYLQNISSFNEILYNHVNMIKEKSINKLNKKELMMFLELLDENELRDLARNMDTNLFIKYYNSTEECEDVKKLIIK